MALRLIRRNGLQTLILITDIELLLHAQVGNLGTVSCLGLLLLVLRNGIIHGVQILRVPATIRLLLVLELLPLVLADLSWPPLLLLLDLSRDFFVVWFRALGCQLAKVYR